MLDLLIKNGKVVFPGKFVRDVDIGVKDGKIFSIGNDIDHDDTNKILDARGKYILPGIVDSHFHIGIYRPFSEDAKSESGSAAAGGVTTILSYFRSGKNYLNTSEPYKQLLSKILELSKGNFYTDYGFNLAPVTRTHVKEIPELVSNGGISTFKYYMFYKGLNLKSEVKKGSVEKEYLLSDDPYDLGHLYNIMEQIASLKGKIPGVRLSIHAEDAEIIRVNLEKVKEDMEKLGLNPLEAYSDARPPASERLAIMEAFELAHETGCPINILHVSSEVALNAIIQMKCVFPDVDVKVETTPSHLSLNVESGAGIFGKVNPPIRSSHDNEALWNGIIDGKIDTVGSDHASVERSKKGTELWSAENGYGATELLLPTLITEGYIKRKVPLEKIAALITLNPARVHAISGKKGDIIPGLDADFVLFDANTKKKVSYKDLHSAQDFSPFEGIELNGWADTTILRGKVVYENGKLIEPMGEFIKRPVL